MSSLDWHWIHLGVRTKLGRLLAIASLSLTFAVAAGSPASAQTLTASPSSLHAGEPLTVNWTATPVHSDWIGLYPVGAGNEDLIWWSYTGDAPSGSFTVEAPSPAGQYEFRYLVNNTFQAAAVSNTVTTQILSGYTVTPSTSIVAPGGTVQVSYTRPYRDGVADWVGLFKVGDSNQQFIWWSFTSGTSGSFSVPMPNTPGTYEFRYLYKSSYTALEYSTPVIVDPAAANYTLTVSPATVAPGGTVTVSWTAPNGSSSLDWIGLFPQGEMDNHNYLWPFWFYTGGATSGSVSFTMPSTPGTYVFRYLLNNGWTHKAEFGPVTVQ